MRLPKKRYLLPGLALALFVIAGAFWLAIPRVQMMRADRLITRANEEIAAANEALAAFDLASISLESFVSPESISQAGESLGNSIPAIDDAIEDVRRASESVDQAAGLSRLPAGYLNYLNSKKEITGVRIEQLEKLKETVEALRMLYEDGDIIFTAVEEMDRLWGQVDYSLQTVQGNPADSSAALGQAAQSMRDLQARIDARYDETGFFLLESLSDSIEDNAKLADLAKSLADAVQAGDQSGAQQAAVALEAQLVDTTDTSAFIDLWIEYSLKPDIDDFQELQEEQEDLDREAAELFGARGQ